MCDSLAPLALCSKQAGMAVEECESQRVCSVSVRHVSQRVCTRSSFTSACLFSASLSQRSRRVCLCSAPSLSQRSRRRVSARRMRVSSQRVSLLGACVSLLTCVSARRMRVSSQRVSLLGACVSLSACVRRGRDPSPLARMRMSPLSVLSLASEAGI